jgi:hypothetical protein
MALIVKDRVREITSTTGTGTITLTAAVVGFQSFSVIGDGNQTYYTIVDAATGAFEVGIGTYTASGTTLSRDTVLESSNANALVSFSSGTKDVFVTYPADRSVSQADIGTEPNEIPLNQYLGSMAYQDLNSVTIDGGVATLDTATITSIQNDTAISNVEPSLMLNFAAVKKLDPRITFARASTATYYDGQTVAKAEENLLLQSQTFDNASWSKVSSTVTANSTTAPDGTTTAETLTATAATSAHVVISSAISCPNGAGLSVFAKQGTASIIQLYVGGSITPYANFDLSAGTAHGFGAGTTASIVNAGDGWYRCQLVSTVTAVTSLQIAMVTSTSSARSESWTALGTETLFLWGAQAENRQFVTAYTPTTTQPIRNYIPVLQTAASGVARFDHNPVTTESLGLLIEEQRTNLLTYSEDFTDGSWVKSNTTITSNTITAPDGTLTGDKLVETSGAGVRQLYKTPSLSAVSHSFSAYFKASERYWFKLNLTGSGAYFDLSTGVIGTIDAGVTAAMTAVGNGWYRCSIVRTVSAGTNYTEIQLALTNGGGSYTGDGYSGIFIWGAQLEAGAFPTSYIPTVASQVTRSADSASMTGTNFSDWFNPSQGTLYAESTAKDLNLVVPFMTIDNNTTNSNEYRIVQINSIASSAGKRIVGLSRSNGVIQGLVPSATDIIGEFKTAFAYKVNDFASSTNGASTVTDNSGVLAIGVDRLRIGTRSGLDTFANSPIKKIAYYPARLSNAELQEMTEQ